MSGFPRDEDGKLHVQLARPLDDVDCWEAARGFPASGAEHTSDPCALLPALLAVNETVKDLPATALPTENPLTVSVAPETVIFLVAAAVAPAFAARHEFRPRRS